MAVAALVDPELITSFEITPGGTIVFWIGILGTVIAMARGMIPEEKLVYDPEEAIKYVVNYTHYLPADWNGKLHSDQVSDIPSDIKVCRADIVIGQARFYAVIWPQSLDFP